MSSWAPAGRVRPLSILDFPEWPSFAARLARTECEGVDEIPRQLADGFRPRGTAAQSDEALRRRRARAKACRAANGKLHAIIHHQAHREISVSSPLGSDALLFGQMSGSEQLAACSSSSPLC